MSELEARGPEDEDYERTKARAPARRLQAEAIDLRGCAAEQALLLGGTGRPREALAGVPEHAVAVGAFVDGEIALEHGAVGAKGFDAGLDVGPPQSGKLFGARRQFALMHVETEQPHAETAQLHVDVGARGERPDALVPLGEHLVALALVAAEPDRAADMVHHDRRGRKGAGEVEQVGKLRMIHESIEAEAKRRQLGEAFAYLAVAQPAFRPDRRGAPLALVR